MPNLHWFATKADHKDVLSEILTLHNVVIYELHSAINQRIRTFSNVEEILQEFDVANVDGSRRRGVHLNLWVEVSGPKPPIERLEMDGAGWRERSGSVGFVQFYLEQQSQSLLANSQTNTVSEARMGAIDGVYTGFDGVV